MKNADMPAMPLSGDAYQDFAGYDSDKSGSSYNPECQGLTKREYFAAKAMQGLMSSLGGYSFEDLAGDAIRAADALLEELEK